MDSTRFDARDAQESDESLRVPEWSGLVARLCAERDLRRELAAAPPAPDGRSASFALGAGEALDLGGWSEPEINPAALADCKSTGGITPGPAGEDAAAGNEARGK